MTLNENPAVSTAIAAAKARAQKSELYWEIITRGELDRVDVVVLCRTHGDDRVRLIKTDASPWEEHGGKFILAELEAVGFRKIDSWVDNFEYETSKGERWPVHSQGVIMRYNK